MAVYQYETTLECSPGGLFDFLARPANVVRITKPDMGITFNSAPDVIEQGSRLEFQIVSYGQVFKSVHQIVSYNRPNLVVEEQLSGPMKSWTHRHEYESQENGVLKRDIVEFQLPGGILGFLLSDAKIKDHLEDGFFFSETRLKDMIERGELK